MFTITYQDGSNFSASENTISIAAIAGGNYRHRDRAVDTIAFAVGQASQALVEVVASGTSLPTQQCSGGAGPGAGLPVAARWTADPATKGTLTLSLPTGTNAQYATRLEASGGGNVGSP
ncbi:MAG: hypothetical protein IPK74_27175 [Deltaproteobacteria bacterium]|nr:hypothetical protein [Deltaproteobacteria bacterium]